MRNYTRDLKEQMLKKMLSPNAPSIEHLSRESSIPVGTLYTWKSDYKKNGHISHSKFERNSDSQLGGATKLSIIVETAAMNEHELSTYCRSKGIYPEQIQEWKALAIAGNDNSGVLNKNQRQQWQSEKKHRESLEREINRKDKALAETAALLVLSKKARAIWGDNEGN